MEVLNCEKHGDYEAKEKTLFSGRVIKIKACIKCQKEKEEEERRIQEEREKKEAERHRLNARLSAGITKRNLYKTFADYKASNEGQNRALKQSQKYVSEFPTVSNLLMLGSVGTGKTMLASIIIENLADQYDCLIKKSVDIFRDVKATYSRDCSYTEQDVLDKLTTIDLLVIDEVGIQLDSDTNKLLMFDIIDGRYQNMLPTILISNLDVDGVTKVIGERCMDRLREGGGSMIAFNWESLRG